MAQEEIQEESFSSDEEFEDDADSESSSDVDAKLAEDDVFDIEFFKCYSALKKKDDKIYDKNVKFFDDELSSEEIDQQDGEKSLLNLNKKSKAPKMTLLDHQLKYNDADQEEPDNQSEFEPKIDLTKAVSKSFYEKELDEIKKNIEKIGEDVNSDSDDELLVVKGSKSGTSVLKPRRKIDAMLDELEEDQDIKHLKQIWTDPAQLSEEDKFLRDYILNKRYMGSNVQEDSKNGFFSSNLEDMSDADTDDDKKEAKDKHQVEHRSDEKDFDKISRIPRNSTKTIRDLVEKRQKKEKRMKKLEKEKKRKRALKDADCEDVVGDLPTKFHYRETEPNDYGLSAEELLMATDEELDKWVALKDAIMYKTPEEELREKEKWSQKRNDIELKKNIFKSIYGEPDEGTPDGDVDNSKVSESKKRKRKREKLDESLESEPTNVEADKDAESQITIDKKALDAKRKKKKHKKRGLNHKKFSASGVAPDRLLAYGLSKTSLKRNKLL